MICRVHALRDTSFIRNSNNAPATHSNLLHVGSQLDLPKACSSVTGFVKSGFEDIVQQSLNFGRNLKETDQSVLKERVWPSGTSIHRTSYQSYYPLDGNRFDSMFDVACHLGLVSNYHSVESQDRSDGFALVQKGLLLNQRRKESLIFSRIKNLRDCQENLKFNIGGQSLGVQPAETQACYLKSNLRVKQDNLEETGDFESLQVRVS